MCGQRPVYFARREPANRKLAYQCGYDPTTAGGPGFFLTFCVFVGVPLLVLLLFFLFSFSSSNFALNFFMSSNFAQNSFLIGGEGGSLAQTYFNSFYAPRRLHHPPLLFLLQLDLLHPELVLGGGTVCSDLED